MDTLVDFLEQKLRLRVNREKSTVAPSRETKVPGLPDLVEWMPSYTVSTYGGVRGEVKLPYSIIIDFFIKIFFRDRADPKNEKRSLI